MRQQIDQLSSSLRIDRPSVTKAMLAAVAAILLAATTGMAEGSVSYLTERDDSSSTISALAERCDALAAELDDVEFVYPHRTEAND